MKDFMSIGEFAKAIGVSEPTLRNWDKSGKLKPHHRTKGNRRVYTKEQAEEFFNNGEIIKIQGRKGRDVYYFNTKDYSVEDKIGNRIYLREDVRDAQKITVEDAMDILFHEIYDRSQMVNAMVESDRKLGDTVKWVRMN